MKKVILFLLFSGLALFLLIQLVPYGRNHYNPPVIQEPAWPDLETRSIAQRACFDCHSNQVRWPWYSNIAPVSWMVQRDVDKGRKELNFSEWGRGEQEIDDMGEVIRKGKMPPRQYLLTHPDARLSTSDQEQLLQGLAAFGVRMGEYEDEDDD